MADYRNDRDLDRVQPKTVQAERSGSSIFLIVAAVIALLAILWFAFSGGDDATVPANEPAAMEQTVPGTTAAPEGTAVPDATIAPEGGTAPAQ